MSAPALHRKVLVSALAAPETRRLPVTRAAQRRVRLWELDDKHHCPVIGSCLTADELTRLARRFFPWVDSDSAFAVHVEAVNQAKTRNPLSEAMQAALERKYRAQISRFKQAASDQELLREWLDHYARGEVAGALWAAVTHRAASAKLRQRVFADVHMLSHQIGAGLAADARRLARVQGECGAAQAALERQKRLQAESEAALRLQLRDAQAECDRLRRGNTQLGRLQQRLAEFESGSVMVDIGHKLLTLQAENSELIAAAQRGWALKKTLQAAHREAQAVARERDLLQLERDALARLLSLGDGGSGGSGELDKAGEVGCAAECERCEHFDGAVAGQCVLYVGGRSALLAQYRALADRLGVRLVHHDGGREESLARLPEMINGADAVVCPTDCVSHSAYYQLKRQCKRSGKPCLLFKGASVSGFAVALARLASGQFSLPAAAGVA